MTKSDIQEGDIITYKNGKKKTINKGDFWVLQEYYDDDMNCIRDEFTIISIERPYYDTIYSRNIYTKHR